MLILKRLSTAITRPLNRLTDSIQIVEAGEFQKAKEYLEGEKRGDEAGILTQEFQIMLDKIMVLIHENYEKADIAEGYAVPGTSGSDKSSFSI